ncbi:MAG: extracellular solute-binding protein [Chloroflexi bacterium]|nr:MAG: extracellular solute-binding protein [Chloroflexota bacterium]TMG37528.1 MAG: extracellular solute-binding protein [Chloroflexota bacterium]
MLLLSACGSTTTTGTADAKTATSAADMGGMSALVTAAKAEGKLNVIALPPNWCDYGDAISAFTAKYGIAVNSENPNGSSQQEVDAINQNAGTSTAPDVVDVGLKVAVSNTSVFAPYKVTTWGDIPGSLKESTGLWYSDYGGFMAIGYDSSKVPGGTINSVQDLLGSGFKSKVALAGDPTQSNQALNGVILASVANGGSLDDVSKGVDFFHQLKVAGNFVPVIGTSATVKAGQTPVLFQWDYNSLTHVKDVSTWKVFVPTNATIFGSYAQAISKTAPHPAAARLWEEFIYSDAGQNIYLKGACRPVRQSVMKTAGTIDTTALSALPAVTGTPLYPTQAQQVAAGTYVSAHWSAAIG